MISLPGLNRLYGTFRLATTQPVSRPLSASPVKIQLSTVDFSSPAGWPSVRRWRSKKRRQAIAASAAVLAVVLARVLNGRCVHRCRCFLSPATRAEPPAGVLAGLQVAAMPTRNSCSVSASTARLLLNLSVRLPRNSTAGGPTVSAPRLPACRLPGPPRTRCY